MVVCRSLLGIGATKNDKLGPDFKCTFLSGDGLLISVGSPTVDVDVSFSARHSPVELDLWWSSRLNHWSYQRHRQPAWWTVPGDTRSGGGGGVPR